MELIIHTRHALHTTTLYQRRWDFTLETSYVLLSFESDVAMYSRGAVGQVDECERGERIGRNEFIELLHVETYAEIRVSNVKGGGKKKKQ